MANMISANLILAALTPRELSRLSPHLQPVALAAKKVLHEAGNGIQHIFFPVTGVVARMIAMEDGACTEVGLVGREGMTGLCALAGATVSPYREIVLVPGKAFRMEAPAFIQEVNRGGSLNYLVRQHLFACFCAVSHFAACNQLHNVRQRCCRLLLMLGDRIETDDFPVTHENLALLLGVRRASVSEVARQLQDRDLIRYRWGRVAILDRGTMESIACRCYHNIKSRFGNDRK